MAISKTWDATVPGPTRDLGLGDDDIRDFKTAVSERFQRAHKMELTDGTTDAAAGRLIVGGDAKFLTGTDDGELAVYDFAGTTSEFEIRDGTHATAPDEVDLKGKDLVDVGDLAGTRTHTIAIPLPFAATGRVNGVYLYNDTGATITLTSADAYANTAPTGAALTIDIHRHTDPWINLSSGGSTILTGGPLSIAASARRMATPHTTFVSSGAWLLHEALAFEIDSVGSTIVGADLVLFLTVTKIA